MDHHQYTQLVAYFHWIARGCPLHEDWTDWFWAEAQENLPMRAPYFGGRGYTIDLYANGGSETDWGPDPNAGVAHALAGVDHSNKNVVRASVIELPLVPDRIVSRIDLTITYDVFTWSTKGSPPHVGYYLLLCDSSYPIDLNEGTLRVPASDSGGPIIVPASSSTGIPDDHWETSFYLDANSSGEQKDTQTFDTSICVRASGSIKLCACAVAWGSSHHVDKKHSGCGVRVIAAIKQIELRSGGYL